MPGRFFFYIFSNFFYVKFSILGARSTSFSHGFDFLQLQYPHNSLPPNLSTQTWTFPGKFPLDCSSHINMICVTTAYFLTKYLVHIYGCDVIPFAYWIFLLTQIHVVSSSIRSLHILLWFNKTIACAMSAPNNNNVNQMYFLYVCSFCQQDEDI